MPNTKSAKKELRKSKKKREYNRQIKENFKELIKKSKKAISEGDKDKAQELAGKAFKSLDKASQKKVIHKNTRDRKKSRLHQKLNSLLKEPSQK
jgi:small subunit ribosomal protein S20